MFNKMSIQKWQQFETVDLDFTNQLTILTGANGTGKTTILNLLAQHNGWQSRVYSTPKLDLVTGAVKFFSRLFMGKQIDGNNIIGSLEYSSKNKTQIVLQDTQCAQTGVIFPQMQPVNCFFIPSHRSIYKYEPVTNIPTAKKMREQAFSEVFGTTINRYFNNHTQSVSFLMKSTLISWVIQGYGVNNGNKQIMPKDQEQIDNFEGFQIVLQKMLPKSLLFEEIEVRNNEIVFKCNNGNDEFLLETASGGISSIIDLAWQIYMYSGTHSEFVVLIDEIENHLHPTMQRRILPDLLDAFPNVKFIVSTHSPLVVSSVKKSRVYAFTYNERNKVVNMELDFSKNARTANEILEEALGLSTTIPTWAQEKLDEIISKYRNSYTEESFTRNLTQDLINEGLSNFIPLAIEGLLK